MFRKNAMLAGLMMASGVIGGVVATSITHVDAQAPAASSTAPVRTTSLTIVDSAGVQRAALTTSGLRLYEANGSTVRTLVSQGVLVLYYDDGTMGPYLDVNGARFNFPQASAGSQSLNKP